MPRLRIYHSLLLTLPVCMVIASPLRADQRIITTIDPVPSGGAHLKTPVKITLTDKKPEGIKKEPNYRFKPLYGIISLGDAKENQILLSLDAEENAPRPLLYADLEGDGDLTREQPIRFTVDPKSPEKNPIYNSSLLATARYNFAGRGGKLPSKILFSLNGLDLKVNTDYGRTGTLSLGNHNYKIALVDQKVDAKYDDFKHEEASTPKLFLYIDRNADGTFDPKREIYDVARPIKISGQTLNVTTIDPRGTRIVFEGTLKKQLTPEMLKPGKEIIDFEAELLDGRTVTFPDDYKGKLVLLQFWATWCPPCREELPGLIKTYREFNSQNFEILAVSIDRGAMKKNLNQFIIQGGLNWDHVYDGKYWDADIAKLFNIKAIPDAYLVDGDTGKIIAMGDDLRPPHLAVILKEALEKKSKE